MPRHSFHLLVLASAVVVLLAVGWAAVGWGGGEGDSRPRAGGAGPSVLPKPPRRPSSPVRPSPPATPPTADVQKPKAEGDDVLAGRIGPDLARGTASLSVAVLDLDDGSRAQYGVRAGTTYDTASIVKVDILAALLLRAQDEDRHLTPREKAYATSMIHVSDNTSADALWKVIGGTRGLDTANRRLGLTATTGDDSGHWGLTQTTATDQLTLLKVVFNEGDVLNQASRSYARGLLGGIARGQDWGVSAAGTVTGLKNGWLPRTTTGLWDVNSIGLVTVGGHRCLMAVVSNGNASMDDGVSLVEEAARAAATALGT